MRTTLLILAMPAALALSGCGQDTTPPAPKTSDATAPSVVTQTTVPTAEADRNTAPAPVPSTHSGTPQSDAPAVPAAATARDTAANQPLDDLTKAEESKAMPMAGQANNHSSPALDKENKTTPPASDKAPAK